MSEVWLPVPGFPSWEVSNVGRFRSGGIARAGFVDGKGRRYIEIKEKGRKLRTTTAAVILLAFVGPRPPRHFAVHLDDDRANESLHNLAWALPAENSRQAVVNGKMLPGSKNPTATLDERRVGEILDKLAAGGSKRGLAREYGVSDFTIAEIASGKRWAHVQRPPGFVDVRKPAPLVEVGGRALSLAGWARELGINKGTLTCQFRKRGATAIEHALREGKRLP